MMEWRWKKGREQASERERERSEWEKKRLIKDYIYSVYNYLMWDQKKKPIKWQSKRNALYMHGNLFTQTKLQHLCCEFVVINNQID